jgi:hypothetical protein
VRPHTPSLTRIKVRVPFITGWRRQGVITVLIVTAISPHISIATPTHVHGCRLVVTSVGVLSTKAGGAHIADGTISITCKAAQGGGIACHT